MAQKKQGFVYGALILMLSNIIVKVLGAIFKIPLANVIGDTAMGYFNSAYSIYSMFFLISTSGLPVAISRMIAASHASGRMKEGQLIYKVSLAIFLIIGSFGSLFLFFGANFIAAIPGEPELATCIRTISPIMFFICLSSCIRGYFQGNQNMTPTAISQVIEVLGNLFIGLTLGLWASRAGKSAPVVAAFVIAGVTLGVVFSALYLCFAKSVAKRDRELNLTESKSFRSKKEIAKELIAIAIPITIASSVLSLTSVIDSMVVVRRMKAVGIALSLPGIDKAMLAETVTEAVNDTTAISIYGAYTSKAVTIFNLPPTIIYPFAISILPAISAAGAKGDRSGVERAMTFTFRIVSVICLPCAIGICAMSRPIIEFLFSSNNVIYSDTVGNMVRSNDIAAPMLSILSIAIIFSGLISVSGAMLQAYGFERKSIISTSFGVLAKLISAFVLIGVPAVGAYGIPISTLLCYLIMFCFNMYFVRKYIGYRLNIRSILLKPLFASILCALSALGTHFVLTSYLPAVPNRISTLLAILIAVLIYGIVLFKIHGVERDDILQLPKGEGIAKILTKLHLLEK